MKNGDKIQFRYNTIDNDQWQEALYYSENELYFLFYHPEIEKLLTYLKDRIETKSPCKSCNTKSADNYIPIYTQDCLEIDYHLCEECYQTTTFGITS